MSQPAIRALWFLTSIPAALILYNSVLNDTGYILGAGDDTRVTVGALLEIFLMIGNVGTAVVMFSDPQAIQRNPLA